MLLCNAYRRNAHGPEISIFGDSVYSFYNDAHTNHTSNRHERTSYIIEVSFDHEHVTQEEIHDE
jgi:hypothetical protein